MKTVQKMPSIHIPIQKPDGSMEWVWYMFLQWLSEHLEDTDLSDYFTKEETNALLSAYYTKTETDDILSSYAIDSNVVHKTGTETITGAKTFTSYLTKLAAGTTFTKQGGQPSVEGGEFHFEKGDSDTTIHNYVVEDLYDGKVRFFGSCNKDGGSTEIRNPLSINFTNNRIDTPSVYINGTLQNDTGTSSRFVPTVGWVNNPTNGVNNIVHKTGEEVIAGTKRFTDLVSLKNISYSLFDNTASSKYLYYNDKDGHATGWVESRINHDSVVGESRLRLMAQTWTDNTFTTNKVATLDVVVKPDGTMYATGPTPTEDNTSSIQVDTVGARNTKLQSYQPLLTAGSNITISGNTISATDTTYSVMTGATSSTAGTSGLVPAPASGDNDKFLKGDGTWGTVTSGNYHPDLFDTKWSDHIVNDIQWLRGDTFSWQNGTVYQAAYDHLVDDIDGKSLTSETVGSTTVQFYLADDGHKICPAAQENNVAAIYAATGVAWYYIIDYGFKRFKLPRTKFGVTGLRDTVGNYVAPGLPNITGDTKLAKSYETPTGACVAAGTSSASAYGAAGSFETVTIDASQSNSIYGNSTTVQPPATQMYLYFYVGEFTQTALENTAGLNASLFNGKADNDLTNAASNASATAKETIVSWGMPSGTKYDTLTLGASGTTYTAPADGYFFLYAEYSSGSNTCYDMYISGTALGYRHWFGANSVYASGRGFVPVKKGQEMTITINGTLGFYDFKFIYADGE